MPLPAQIPPENLVLEATQKLQEKLEALPGMLDAPWDNPPKKTSDFPFPVVTMPILRWRSKPQGTKTGLHVIRFEIHTGLQAKPRDLVTIHRHIEPIANLLMFGDGRNLFGTITGFVNPAGSDVPLIEASLESDMSFLSVPTIGWIYEIEIKQVYAVPT